MRVFVTGATGFIGTAIVRELMSVGHRVLGLARSDEAAASLTRSGVEVHRGDLSDLESLAKGAYACDGVIHTAFIHDFSKYAAAAQTDMLAVEALGTALEGTGRAFIVTSVTSLLASSQLGTEEDAPIPHSVSAPRTGSEMMALSMVKRGVRACAVRLPEVVHGDSDSGFAPALMNLARKTRVSAYVAAGLNRWPAVHVLDAANLYRLALEKGSAGARFHAVAEEGVALRDIATAVGLRADVPVISKSEQEATKHFGWLEPFVSVDNPTSSAQTRQRLQWCPMQPGLIADINRPGYFEGI